MISIKYKKYGILFGVKITKNKLAFFVKMNGDTIIKIVLTKKKLFYACCIILLILGTKIIHYN